MHYKCKSIKLLQEGAIADIRRYARLITILYNKVYVQANLSAQYIKRNTIISSYLAVYY